MLKLVKMEEQYWPQLTEMMDEWTASGEKIIPWSIRKCDYHHREAYLDSLEVKEEGGKLVPDSTYFCLDTEENAFVGAVNIRHRLNERLLHAGGTHWRRHTPQPAGQWPGHGDDRPGAGKMPGNGHTAGAHVLR